jgi:hypothetical protein
MPRRDRFAPEDREKDVELYDAAPPDMPPSPAGADVENGGEAAASRRLAGLPPHLARNPEHRVGEASPEPEPFLGYDGLPTDDVLGWIADADPDPEQLRTILDYERTHGQRALITDECRARLQRWEESE